jgi:hypothetical protein
METDVFKELNCRLLVILLVVSSLRISEYSRNTSVPSLKLET